MEPNFEALQAFTEQIYWPLATATASSLLHRGLANSLQTYLAEWSKASLCSGLLSFVFSTETSNVSAKQGHLCTTVFCYGLLAIRNQVSSDKFYGSKQPLKMTMDFVDFHWV